jgi:hypothetical protein
MSSSSIKTYSLILDNKRYDFDCIYGLMLENLGDELCVDVTICSREEGVWKWTDGKQDISFVEARELWLQLKRVGYRVYRGIV